MNVRELLESNVSKYPLKTYVYFKDQEVNYRTFDDLVNKLANGLLGQGIKKGDRICFLLPNCLEFLYFMFACAKIGAVSVPVNTGYKGREVKYVLEHSESCAVVTTGEFLTSIEPIRQECQSLKDVIVVDEPVDDIGVDNVSLRTAGPYQELRNRWCGTCYCHIFRGSKIGADPLDLVVITKCSPVG